MTDYCVCAEPIEERGIYPCGHALCLTCTLKKRVLMRDDSCPYCRAPGPNVAVVTSANSPPERATIDFKRCGIKAETQQLIGDLSHILSFPCPLCDDELKNYKKLRTHVHKDHKKLLCDVCTKHEFVFSNEYQTFDSAKAHQKHLERDHIRCKYCNQYFYSTTEFSKHCRQTHFGCEVCERRDPQHPKYFRTYDELFQHYTDAHYACMVPVCLEDKHIVFSTQMELQSHMLEAHPGLIGNRRDFQRVDLAQLSLSEADSIEEPTVRDDQENFIGRYMARLDIVANHDSEKVEQIRSVNKTYLGKKVPVEIFIATYESVLKNADKPQVTALLTAFSKAYGSQLAGDARRQLTFALQKRTQTEDEASDNERRAQRQSLAKSGQLGPAPTKVQKFGWGNTSVNEPRLLGKGLNGFASLPQLGQGDSATSGPVGRGASSSSYARAASNYKPSTRQIQGLNRLPSLPPPKPQNQVPMRQTRIPLRTPARSSTHLNSYTPSAYTGWRGDSPSSRSSPEPATTPQGSEPSLSSSSSSSASSASSSTSASSQRKPRLNNLPSLPGGASSSVNNSKKKKHNVIRLV